MSPAQYLIHMSLGWLIKPFLTQEKYLGVPVVILTSVFFFVVIIPSFIAWKYFNYFNYGTTITLCTFTLFLSILLIKKVLETKKIIACFFIYQIWQLLKNEYFAQYIRLLNYLIPFVNNMKHLAVSMCSKIYLAKLNYIFFITVSCK